MLITQGVRHTYDQQNWIDIPNIVCKADETHLILGHSGTGKTTLLHILCGILKPTQGKVEINNQDIYTLSQRKLDQFRGDNIGIIFQQPHFIASLSVLENLLLAQRLAGHAEDRRVAEASLDKLNVGHKINTKTKNLSVGEKQRVAIARALINKPLVILADEPTSALDDKNCAEVIDLIQTTAHEAKASLLIVTHDNRLKSVFSNQIHFS